LYPHSSPTRRSSDLRQEMLNAYSASAAGLSPGGVLSRFGNTEYGETRERLDIGRISAVRADYQDLAKLVRITSPHLRNARIISRSEEHTSELQSRGH